MSDEQYISEDTPVLSPAFVVGGLVMFGENENLPPETGEVATLELAVYVPAAEGIAILPLVMEIELAEQFGLTPTPQEESE